MVKLSIVQIRKLKNLPRDPVEAAAEVVVVAVAVAVAVAPKAVVVEVEVMVMEVEEDREERRMPEMMIKNPLTRSS